MTSWEADADSRRGRKLTRAERKAVEQRVERGEFHGEWSYTIAAHDPVQDPPTSPEQKLAAPIPPEATFLLTHPALTGMSRDQFDQLEPCRQILTDAERRDDGSDGRGRTPASGSSITAIGSSPQSSTAATPSP
ncbi:hypothetical protein [Streptomyces sp. NBC_01285]|uniref:hypothetical protein n=1 Tax=Streptomyces sp. NBC_01285 TaxID=2903813 RepID=UPI0022583E8F|nr:hypothetical protein [Streptomyces sp. NBC_01285]MCX4774151.1 hypothetical protein [Streptomyces sp. NBC_01285]